MKSRMKRFSICSENAVSCALRSLTRIHAWLDRSDQRKGKISYNTIGKLVANIPLCIIHPGTAYRLNSKHADYADRMAGIRTRFIGADLLELATNQENRNFVQYPYLQTTYDSDEDNAKQHRDTQVSSERIKVLHSPSNTETKGTSAIREALGLLTDIAKYSEVRGVSWDIALQEKAKCDLYVDQLNLNIGGFGASSIEAMSYGKAVAASLNKINVSLVEEHWKMPPILDIRSKEDLEAVVRKLADKEELDQRQKSTREWYRDNASHTAISKWLCEKFTEAIKHG
jgi:hypothetical protein